MSTETFAKTMNGASIEAQKYATNIKNGTGSSQTFATNQKVIQSSMNETSIVSQIAATGLNLFKAALNSFIFFAVIEGIQLLIKGLDSLILTAEEAEEKAESLRNNMQSFFDEVQSGQKTISSISDRFSELNEHVTETGENIDLTNDEYSEYLDICNQVKSIMPELISGYTNEGNAIITLKDNVDSLTESYKENIRIKAATFVSNGDDDGNTIESFFDDYKIFTEGEGGLFAPSAGGAWNNKSTDYEDYYGYDTVHEWLSDVADLTLEDLQKLKKGTTQATYLYALLKENGYELANITEGNYEAVHDVLNTRLTSLESEMTTRVSNIRMSLQQMLYADTDYWDIDNQKALSAINSLFSDVDAEFIKQNNLLGKDALQAYESNVIKLFKNDDTQQSMIDIYTPQGQDESIVDYSKRVNDAIQEIQDYVTDKQINIPLNFNSVTNNAETLQKQYNSAIEQTKDKFESDTSAATEALKAAQENLQDEYAKIEDWGLGDYADQIKNGTIQSVFGNVDMDNRQVIDWTSDNIEKWKDALSDIKYYDEEGNFIDSYYDQLKESVENGENCIDTVFGDMIDYIEGYDGITALAFSHIVNNDDGTFEFLGQKTAEEYLYGILDAAKQDGDMSIDHILELDKKGFENAEVYDAEGRLIGQTYIHGIISGFNENADDVSMLTHFAGKYGAVNLAEQAIEEAKKMQEDFDWDSWFKENSINTKEEIDNWLEIAQAANSAAEAVEMYNKVKNNDNKTSISLLSQIQSLEKLSDGFNILDEIYADVKDKGTFEFGNLVDEDFVEEFSKYKEEYNDFIKTVSSSPTDIDACQSAFNNLVTAWIDGSGALNDINDETKQVAIDMLTNKGVTNATEVVYNRYAKSIITAKTQTEEYKKAIKDESYNLADLANSITYTTEEKEALIKAHPELRNQFKETDKGIQLEETAYESLGLSVKNLTVLQREEQVKQSQIVMDGVSSRLEAYKIELSAIQDLATALSSINNKSINNAVFSAMDYQDYKSMIEMDGRTDLMLNDGKMLSKEEFDALKKQTSQVLSYGVALENLNKAKENLANLDVDIQYGGGNKSKDGDNSSSSSNSPKEYDDHREYSDFYDEVLSTKEKAIDNFVDENEKLNRKFEKALEDDDIATAEIVKNNSNKSLKDTLKELAQNANDTRYILNEDIMPKIVGIAAQFGFDWSNLNISEISDVDLEKVRQALQNEIYLQQDIGVDMQNAEKGDNAYNIKTAELALEQYESLLKSAQSYYDLVGEKNGQGEWGTKYLETQEQILENNLKYQQKITSQTEEQVDNLNHQIELLDAQNSVQNAETIRNLYSNQINLIKTEADRIREELANNRYDYSIEGIKELEKQIDEYSVMWWDVQDKMVETYQNVIDEQLSIAEDWLSHEDAMNRLNLQSKENSYENMIKNIKKIQDEFMADERITLEKRKELYEEITKQIQEYEESIYDIKINAASDAYEKVIEMIENNYDVEKELAEELHEQKMDNYDEELDKIREIYDNQKSLLEEMKDEEDYQKELSEKQSEADLLQSRINALGGDDSDYAAAQRIELQKQLSDKLEEISELQKDHEHEQTIDALDKDLDALEDYYDDVKKQEEDAYEEYLKQLDEQYSETNKHTMALEALANDYFNLLNEDGTNTAGNLTTVFTAFAETTGEKFENLGITFDETIQKLERAVELYNSNPEVFSGDISKINSSSNSTTLVGISSQTYTPKTATEANYINQMKMNSIAWSNTSDENVKENLHEANVGLAYSLGEDVYYNSGEGRWYKDDLPLYHTGKLGTNETLAKILKSEAVLTEAQQKMLASYIQPTLNAIDTPNIVRLPDTSILKKIDTNTNFTFAPNITIKGNADEKIIKRENNNLYEMFAREYKRNKI